MSARSTSIQSRLEREERAILADFQIQGRITAATSTSSGLKRFAEAFYFCRVGFVRANFMLGARCPNDERYWIGIARNLWEEAGGGSGPAHNALYREFLAAAGGIPEGDLVAPAFATRFNAAWDEIVTKDPIVDALVAFAAYEALDAPDYQTLFHALRPNLAEASLAFFKIHTEVRHVELFDDAVDLVGDDAAFEAMLDRIAPKVVDLQKAMWLGLLDHISAQAMAAE